MSMVPPGEPEGSPPTQAGRIIVSFALFAGLYWILYRILAPYLVSLLWGAILAYAFEPIYRHLNRWIRPKALSAAVTTALFLGVILFPLLSLALPLSKELVIEAQNLKAFLADPNARIPAWISGLPLAGPKIDAAVSHLKTHPEGLPAAIEKLQSHLLSLGNHLLAIATDLGKFLLRLFIFILTFFSFLLHGPDVWKQLCGFLTDWAGDRMKTALRVIPATTKGVLYGVFFTALAQAFLSGIGYWAAGLSNVLLLTTISFFAALFPVGAVLIWAPATIYLVVIHHWIAAIVFGSWNLVGGMVIEHFLKPMFIGRSSHISFLAILLGVLGGLESFGLIGIFIGPVVLAVALALWKTLRSPLHESP